MLHASLCMLLLAANSAEMHTGARVLNAPSVSRGAEGQIMIGGTTSISLDQVSIFENPDDAERNHRTSRQALTAQLSPSVGAFVYHNLAIGMQGDFGIVRAGPHRLWSLAIGPQFLAHIPLGHNTSLLPKVAIAYRRACQADSVVLALGLDCAVHLDRGFSLTWGPHVVKELYGWRSSSKASTAYGIKLGVLGWL